MNDEDRYIDGLLTEACRKRNESLQIDDGLFNTIADRAIKGRRILRVRRFVVAASLTVAAVGCCVFLGQMPGDNAPAVTAASVDNLFTEGLEQADVRLRRAVVSESDLRKSFDTEIESYMNNDQP